MTLENAKKIQAIWDGDGWYFRGGDHEGTMPGHHDLTDRDMADEDIADEARLWAIWCGLDATDNVEIIR